MRGVIAAIATPVTGRNEPDHGRFLDHARALLAGGCDGLNVLGTTGEATSFPVAVRQALMALAARELPRDRLMVGTGAAAMADAVALTRSAAEMGFAGALILPPFYYKGVSDEGLFHFIAGLAEEASGQAIPIYLYNFPQMTGIVWSVELVRRLRSSFGTLIAGLKDSSGDLAYARSVAAVAPDVAVFPSNESALIEARTGAFAGCISATANLNADYCARALRHGDVEAMAKANAIRSLFDGRPVVAGIKAALAARSMDQAWSRVVPPLQAWTERDGSALSEAVSRIRGTA